MSKEKVEIITVYVENKGRGKASIADSAISVQEFPNKIEGKQAVGVLAIKVEMPKGHLKAFDGLLKAHYPHQLNILSVEEYEAAKKAARETAKKAAKEVREAAEKDNPEDQKEPVNPDVEMEKQFYEAAMNGGDDEILAYLDAYPGVTGAHSAEVQDRSAYVDARAANTVESYEKYLKDYPNGIYTEEVKKLFGD